MTIELSPGQTMSLRGTGRRPARVRMGLAWTSREPGDATEADPPARRRWFGWRPRPVFRNVDLDASALLFSADGTLLDQVWFGRLRSTDGSVWHSGDNVTGRGVGDLESIHVDLAALPADVTTLVFTVNSFTGQQFSVVGKASCRLVDETDADEELGSFNLTASGPHTAQIMAKLTRAGTHWTMTALGAPAGGHTYRDLLTVVTDYL